MIRIFTCYERVRVMGGLQALILEHSLNLARQIKTDVVHVHYLLAFAMLDHDVALVGFSASEPPLVPGRNVGNAEDERSAWPKHPRSF